MFSKFSLKHMNMISVFLLCIVLVTIGFLHYQNRLPFDLNIFVKHNREYYLQQNRNEIKNDLFEDGKIKVKLEKTELKYGYAFFKNKTMSNCIYLIKNNNEIIIVYQPKNYISSTNIVKLENYYRSYSGYLNLQMERSKICRKMLELLDDICQKQKEGDLPRSGMIIYDEESGLAAFMGYNLWTAHISSIDSLFNAIIFESEEQSIVIQ